MDNSEPCGVKGKMEKSLRCRWQLILGAVLALVCLANCQPKMPPAPRPMLPPPPPAAVPEAPPQRETFYVKVGRLNLRAGPGMDFPKLGLLERNEEVEQVGEAQNWYQIRVKKDGSLGWVASEYLSKTPVPSPIETPVPGPAPAPAVRETPPPEPAKPKPSKVETSVPRAPKPAEAAEPPVAKAKPAEEKPPTAKPEPKVVPQKPAPVREEPSMPPPPPPPAPEEKPSDTGIRIM